MSDLIEEQSTKGGEALGPKFNPYLSSPKQNKNISDNIPFDIQLEIIKRLPVKSLIQFRSVSKQWKSFIDNPKFIKNYHINHTNPQHHRQPKIHKKLPYTSIIDNNTFPQQKFPLTTPETLCLLRNTLSFSSFDGLLWFHGDIDSKTQMVVIWNPTIRKSVAIVIPYPEARYIELGFGVCPDTSDPKLVKIIVDKISCMWVVEVFTLSTRVWKTVYMGAPLKSCNLVLFEVFVNGVMCFRAYDDRNRGVRSNFVISFDLKSEKFGEVCLPERLVHAPLLEVAKVNESLGLLEHYDEGDMWVCGVWRRKDGANKPFTKIYTVKVEGESLNGVLGFRNNGEIVVELYEDNYKESRIVVYEPSSGHINGVGFNGKRGRFDALLYMETLLLLDQSDSIIHQQR